MFRRCKLEHALQDVKGSGVYLWTCNVQCDSTSLKKKKIVLQTKPMLSPFRDTKRSCTHFFCSSAMRTCCSGHVTLFTHLTFDNYSFFVLFLRNKTRPDRFESIGSKSLRFNCELPFWLFGILLPLPFRFSCSTRSIWCFTLISG